MLDSVKRILRGKVVEPVIDKVVEKTKGEQLISLVKRAREMDERNASLARDLKERLEEKDENNRTYRYQSLYAQYFGYDWHVHSVLNLLLRETAFGDPSPCPTPIRDIPADLKDEFTLGGSVPVEDEHWIDDTYPSNYPLIYTDAEIDCYRRRVQEGQTYIYGGLDLSVRQALERYPVDGLNVVNLGSITPWYESTLMEFGANPTTLDYNAIICETDKIQTLVVPEVDLDSLTFDAAMSISSFEHDGLGAYGDPIDPDGDLKAMDRLKKIVKPGGLLYLNVPVGPDKIMWNRARVFGPQRLPLLIQNWTLVDSFGMREEFLEGKFNGDPVLVLRND